MSTRPDRAPHRLRSGDLFPTDDPVAPDQLIGRDYDIDQLASALGGGTNLVVAEPRRTGKTSVCEAALTILGGQKFYTAALDLWEMTDVTELAEALVTRVIANRPAAKRLMHEVRRKGHAAATNVQVRSILTLKGEFGDDVELAFEPGLAARDPMRYLRFALRLAQSIAEKDTRKMVLFFDEFQSIRDLEASGRGSDPEALQKMMRSVFQRAPDVSFLFAGSLEHLMRDIFGPSERPLSGFGGFHPLQPISADDWRNGLTARYAKDGCTIDDVALERLIERGELHPRSTMLIAQQAHLASVQDVTREIDSTLVEFGFGAARQLDKAKHEQIVDRIRKISSGRTVNRNALRVARRIAERAPVYKDLSPEVARRATDALNDAGVIRAKEEGRGWTIVDPLFRRFLTDLDPAGV